MLTAGPVLGIATAGFGAALWRFVSEAILMQAKLQTPSTRARPRKYAGLPEKILPQQ